MLSLNRLTIIGKTKTKDILKEIIARGEYDIFHPTYFDPYFLDYLHDKPFVLTVFDMIYELFPEFYPSSQQFLNWKSLLAKEAAKIIAISENTKKDLMELYKLPSDKIEVVYLANSLNAEIVKQNNVVQKIKSSRALLVICRQQSVIQKLSFLY